MAISALVLSVVGHGGGSGFDDDDDDDGGDGDAYGNGNGNGAARGDGGHGGGYGGGHGGGYGCGHGGAGALPLLFEDEELEAAEAMATVIATTLRTIGLVNRSVARQRRSDAELRCGSCVSKQYLVAGS